MAGPLDRYGQPKPEDFGDVLLPSEAAEPILGKRVRDLLMDWLTEIWAEQEMVAAKLKPRKRALMDGPPGVGKTTLAHHLAARLGLPMLAVRPERLIDSWLGSSGRNIGALFDLAASLKDPIVLFLDEFDAVASKRRQSTRQGAEDERNAWVNTLLQRIEKHNGFLIAATNFGSDIDPAIWRRFHIHMTLDMPGQFERERILARYLDPYGLPKNALKLLAEACETASPALIREFCEGLKRHLVIGPKVGWDMSRGAAVGRIVESVKPHRDQGKPRLWSHAADDDAVRAMPWPLPLLAEIPVEEAVQVIAETSPTVVPFEKRG